MKVVIIGLGSMGKRRARLLRLIDSSIEIIGVDRSTERRKQCEETGMVTFCELDEALAQKPDAAFVCTPPLSHAVIIKQLLSAGVPVFSELNLVADGYPELIYLAEEKKIPLFLGCTMLARKETRFIQQKIQEFAGPVSYSYHIGQYLPNWHPWENYTDFFVGDKRTNGCREIWGIELPWLLRAFGNARVITACKRKLTDLKIDFADSWLITLQHENGTVGSLIVDVVCPKALRSFTCYGEGFCVQWQGTPTSVTCWNKEAKEMQPVSLYDAVQQDARYSDNIVENAYSDEIMAFLRTVADGTQPAYSFADDEKCIALMEEIEEAAQ